MRAVRIPEGDVNAGDLLVLENVADDIAHGDIGADGEFADSVAVLVGMAIGPELIPQLTIIGFGFDETIALNLDRERRIPEIAVLLAEVVPYYTIDDKDAVHFERCGEGLAARQIARLVRADNAAGLEPLQIRRKG